MATSTRQAYEFGVFRLEPAERALLRQGEPVPLTPKVFDTLLLLVENAGRLITKDEFMKQVWADAFVEDATLAQSISQLRKALGDSEVIETVPKKGYRFLGPVRTVDVQSQTSRPNSSSASTVQPTAGADGKMPSRRKASLWFWSIGPVVLLAGIVLFYVYEHKALARPSISS